MLANHYTFQVSTAELLSAAAIVITVLGAMWILFRWMITTTVETRLEETVSEQVNRHVQIVDAKMDAMLLNQRETSAAIGKVHDLEVTIKNGLNARVAEIDRKVDLLMAAALGVTE